MVVMMLGSHGLYDIVEKTETGTPTTSRSSCQASMLEAAWWSSVCVHCTYLISPFFKITKANVGINLASEYLNVARGIPAVFRPAWCIHCSRFTVGTDRKRETIIHVSIINGQIKAINPNQVKCLYISTFSRQWD